MGREPNALLNIRWRKPKLTWEEKPADHSLCRRSICEATAKFETYHLLHEAEKKQKRNNDMGDFQVSSCLPSTWHLLPTLQQDLQINNRALESCRWTADDDYMFSVMSFPPPPRYCVTVNNILCLQNTACSQRQCHWAHRGPNAMLHMTSSWCPRANVSFSSSYFIDVTVSCLLCVR